MGSQLGLKAGENTWPSIVPRPPVGWGELVSLLRRGAHGRLLLQTLEFFCDSIVIFKSLLHRNIS